MGEAKRRKESEVNYGRIRNPEYIPFNFFVISDESESWFLGCTEKDSDDCYEWFDHPQKAVKFSSEKEAGRRAWNIVISEAMEFDLRICGVKELSKETIEVTSIGEAREGIPDRYL